MKTVADFSTTVCGIPCGVVIVDYTFVPPFNNNPRLCDSDWDYYGYEEMDWYLVNRKGYKAEWLENKMSDSDTASVKEEISNYKRGDE